MIVNIIVAMVVALMGIVFMVLGYLLWKKERISLLHEYHYDKVSKEDKKIFYAISGMGVIIIGIGLLNSGLLMCCIDSVWSMLPFAVGFVIGLAMLMYAGIKYNRCNDSSTYGHCFYGSWLLIMEKRENIPLA